jgi:hypothetical protein
MNRARPQMGDTAGREESRPYKYRSIASYE